jgi:hypothetical protein
MAGNGRAGQQELLNWVRLADAVTELAGGQ